MSIRSDHVARLGRHRSFADLANPALDSAASLAAAGRSGAKSDAPLVVARQGGDALLLRRSNALLRAMGNYSGDRVLLVDANLRICCANRGFAGLSVAQLVGRRFEKLLPEAVRLTATTRLRGVLATSHHCTFEVQFATRASGVLEYECRAAPIHDDELGEAIVIAMRDITERKRLEAEIIAVSSRERETIGRELHDALGQELTGIALLLRSLATRSERRSPDIARDVCEMIGLVNHAHATARGLVRGVVPVAVPRGGLRRALQDLAQHCMAQYGLPIEFSAESDVALRLGEVQSGQLYRIAQEAMTNAARHACAGMVKVSLRVTQSHFVMEVSDNGIGVAASRRPGSGMGMSIMRYRAGLIGAAFEVVSQQPCGTTIRVTGNQETPVVQP